MSRIDWDEWPNQLNYGRNVFGFEAPAAPSNPGRFEFASSEKLPMFPNPGVGTVGTDPDRISPRMDRQQAIVDRSGNVHRAAVHAHDKSRDAY